MVSLRWSRGLFALPVLMISAVVVAYTTASSAVDDYPLPRVAAAHRSLVLLSPLLAAWTADRSHALRGFLRAHEPVRRRPAALFLALWPLFAAAALAQLVALGAARVVPWDPQAVGMTVTTLVALLASFVLGAAAGQAFPRVIALSAPAVALFLWHVVPAGVSPYWLRYANSTFVTCCTPEQQLSTLVYRASIGVAAVWALGVLILLATRLKGRPFSLGLGVVVAVGVAAGSALVESPAGALTVQVRAEQPVCATEKITVCVWPEHADQLPAEVRLFTAVRASLEKAGLNMPDAYSESPLHPTGALRIEAASYATDADRRFTVATALLPDPQRCVVGSAEDAKVHGVYNGALRWLSRKSGMTEAEIQSRLGPIDPSDSTMSSVFALPPDEQRQWYLKQRALLDAKCGG
ncbi:hypothetical protein AB0B20_18930 [Micromonospora sp. NPDC049151]|uniref:DUF7224 domain-containing protein n=1 Tax=Micromonospora sp. NPDC049151 TaxID=3155648 RepID=UPI0033E89ED3